MTRHLQRGIKRILTCLGRRLPDYWLHELDAAVNYMMLGRWMFKQGFQVSHKVRDKWAVFDHIARIVRHVPVLYLEFGVATGASMRYWSHELRHPESVLHGFDSFVGLPEDFLMFGPYTKGAFDMQGRTPGIDDNRVKFFKGWFDQVLLTYVVPEHKILIVNIDADLYSSTITVLRYLRPYLKAGAYLYFDDMCRVEHEPKAFGEFIKETNLGFHVVSADVTLNHVFFKCDGPMVSLP